MALRKSTPSSATTEEDVPVTDIRAAVAKALCAIIEEAPSLAKDATNAHANYKYVSIDSYYEVFPKVAAKHGLTWVTREVAFSTIDSPPDERGKVRTLVCVRYAFDVYLAGVGYIPDFTTFTLIHQLTGAQTAGSCVSYAEKVFIRTAMKAVTGEKDADADAPQDVRLPRGAAPMPGLEKPAAPAPARPANNEAKALLARAAEQVNGLSLVEGTRLPELKGTIDGSTAVEIFRVFAPLCPTTTALREFYTMNKPALERMKQEDPGVVESIMSLLNARRDEINKEKTDA